MDITNSFYSNFSKYNIPVIKNGVRLPQVNITPEERQKAGVKPDAGNYEYLKKITWNGCKEKAKEGLTGAIKDQIVARLKNEFEVLEKTGTTDYILLLNDIVKQFKGNNIQMGCSRGSAGGAYSLYALDIIGLDGIKYDLLFSRFLNESRAKCQIIDGVKHVDGSTMCDVDIDVEQARRPEAVKLIEDRYPGKTAHISTVQYLTSKTALKNTLKAYLEYSESDSKAITDCIEIVFGKVDSLEKTYEKNKTFQQWADKPENKRALEIAKKLSGLYNTFGCHASGILVSYYDLNDIMPMELSSSGEIVSGYSMEYALSFVAKIDILGISTLKLRMLKPAKLT
jgi:DNA polymerase-3 subunit alpha